MKSFLIHLILLTLLLFLVYNAVSWWIALALADLLTETIEFLQHSE